MKIVYIHQHFATPKDAAGTRSYEFARRLVQHGHEVTMICAASDFVLSKNKNVIGVEELSIDGIKVLRSQISYSTHQNIPQRIVNFIRFALQSLRLTVAEKNVDLVFATSTPLTVAIPGVLGAWRLKVPFVLEIRDLWPELPRALGVKNPLILWSMKRLELWAYRHSSRIIALAPGILEGIAQTNYPREKISLIPNCSDTSVFLPRETPNMNKEIILTFTGAHGIANGLDAIFDAANVLKQRNEVGIQFLLIGQGSQKSRLVERCKELKLDNVSFRNFIPKFELANELRQNDVGLMILKNVPAFYKGTSPNKFFDYIAAGLPVLVNYPGWLKDIINEHQCGIAVPPDDPNAMADAIVYLRDHPDERVTMGRNSRMIAEKLFDRDTLADAFIKVLEEALEKGRR